MTPGLWGWLIVFSFVALAAVFYRRTPKYRLPRVKFFGDLVEAAKFPWNLTESEMARLWLVQNENLIPRLTLSEWDVLLKASHPKSLLRRWISERKAGEFRNAIALCTSPGATVRVASDNAPLDHEAMDAVISHFAVFFQKGVAVHPWHWGELWLLSKNRYESAALGYWINLAEKLLRRGTQEEILKFLREAHCRRIPLEPEWESLLLGRVDIQALSDPEAKFLTEVAEEAGFDRFLERLHVKLLSGVF